MYKGIRGIVREGAMMAQPPPGPVKSTNFMFFRRQQLLSPPPSRKENNLSPHPLEKFLTAPLEGIGRNETKKCACCLQEIKNQRK